jgi:Domain of unknown function (DUF892)
LARGTTPGSANVTISFKREARHEQDQDLERSFHDTLKDIYFAEKKILSALPKMAKAAQSEELRAAFEKHQ